ncbi:MAG TPA: aldo/keto reductase [candidate division Zixibacteria bacterium]|nr:aldo/keto reductase [candidate division Zixibacteria bacterium]
MEYRQLGSSGVRVSAIGLGCNRLGAGDVPQAEVERIVGAALDSGINFFDTADIYTEGRSEESLGQALRGSWNRVVIATKFSFPRKDGPNTWGASRYHIMQAIDASLRRLQTDHVDLYYVHRWDSTTPIEETLRALDDLIRAGKVRYVGASAFASWQLAHANAVALLRGWSPFVAIQSEYNLLSRDVEREVLPYCRAQRVGFVPYYPLAGGFLTGKYEQGKPPPPGSRGESNRYVRERMTEDNFKRVARLAAWAEQRGRRVHELAQAWLLAQPQVCSVITGATRAEQVIRNVAAVDWKLGDGELAEVEALLRA